MNLFRSNVTPLFLHKETAPREEGEYRVILSPQFYWVKKVSLPVKRVGDAKRLAESVFEGALPEGHFSYEVLKADDGDFIIIAYDRDAISQLLSEKFVKNAHVKSVHFAQLACKDLDTCCSIDEASSLVNINGLLMQIPRNCTDPKLEIDAYLKDLKPGSDSVKLGSLDVEVVDRRTFVMMSAALVLFLAALGIEYFDYKKGISNLEESKAALIQKYDLPPTTMQLESIRNRLFKTYKTQKRIREAMAVIAKLPLQKDEYIKLLDIDDKRAEVEIVLSDPKREAQLKRVLAKKYKILESHVDDKTLTLKIAV
jgi:hypothetical protein